MAATKEKDQRIESFLPHQYFYCFIYLFSNFFIILEYKNLKIVSGVVLEHQIIHVICNIQKNIIYFSSN